jgi:hypothetical protein
MLQKHHLTVFYLLLGCASCALCKEFIVETKDDGKSAVEKSPPIGGEPPSSMDGPKQPGIDPLIAMLDADQAPSPLSPKKKGKCKSKLAGR